MSLSSFSGVDGDAGGKVLPWESDAELSHGTEGSDAKLSQGML